jgi:death-on-curing protein
MDKNDDTLFCFRCYHTWKKRIKSRPSKLCPRCHSPYWNKPRKKVSKEFVLKMQQTIINIHNKIIELSGGENGIREEGGIYNSTYKLLNHQYKNQRNPTSIGAFALNEFAKRHYFVDGNKRTSYAIAKIFMLINKCHLQIQYKEATKFMIETAKYDSKITFDEIKKWLDNNCNKIEQKDVEVYLNQAFVNLTLGGDENGE